MFCLMSFHVCSKHVAQAGFLTLRYLLSLSLSSVIGWTWCEWRKQLKMRHKFCCCLWSMPRVAQTSLLQITSSSGIRHTAIILNELENVITCFNMSSFFNPSVKFYSSWRMLDVRLSLSTRCTPAQLNELWHMKRRPLRVVDGMARRKQSPSCNGRRKWK